MEKGKVISVVSGKGGTGKTLFAANIGALLALQGKKIALLDLDLGLRNMDLCLGLENKVVFNVMDVIWGICGIKRAMVKDKRFKDNLYLLAASHIGDERDITPLHVEVLCNRLRNDFDYIIIDAPAGAGDSLLMATNGADKVIIITEPENAALRDADTVYLELQKMGIKDVCCVINKVKSELMAVGATPGPDAIAGSIQMPVAGFIQYDDNIFIANNRGVPVVLKPDTYIEKNFKKILDRILQGEYKRCF